MNNQHTSSQRPPASEDLNSFTSGTSTPEELRVFRNFRRIYTRAAGDGREARLFGLSTLSKAEAALRKHALDASDEAFYFEFPLSGEARMDLLLQYNCGKIRLPITQGTDGSLSLPSEFASFFESCAKDPQIASYLVGFSFDLSEGRDAPGIYLLPPRDQPNIDYVPDMLDRLKASSRLQKVMEAFGSVPAGWQPYYVGCMDSRPDSPTRLGFFLDQVMSRRYREDKPLLKKDLTRCCRRPVPENMLNQIHLLFQKGYVWDIQLDMFPDGDFARALGVSVRDDADKNAWNTTESFLTSNLMPELMLILESWGLADERWRLVREACSAVRRNVLEGIRIKTVADLVSISTCKVRFKNDEAVLAKDYLFARSCDL